MNELKVGDEIIVIAWWNKDKPVKCQIRTIYNDGDYLVLPSEGNPHSRMVKKEDVVHE